MKGQEKKLSNKESVEKSKKQAELKEPKSLGTKGDEFGTLGGSKGVSGRRKKK